VVKPHLKKVEVSVTPGLPVCLDLLLQLSFPNVRDIKKSVTVIVGTGVIRRSRSCDFISVVDPDIRLIRYIIY
jgi:hypothetical protein